MSMTETSKKEENLMQLHRAAEESWATFSYAKPDGVSSGKGFVSLGRKDIVRGVVQVVKKNGGENNLHYHTNASSFWMVLKGRVRFYGPDDKVIGEFGPYEGTMTPRYARYWFENIGDDDLEILQVGAYGDPNEDSSGRTDSAPQRYQIHTSDRYEGVVEPKK